MRGARRTSFRQVDWQPLALFIFACMLWPHIYTLGRRAFWLCMSRSCAEGFRRHIKTLCGRWCLRSNRRVCVVRRSRSRVLSLPLSATGAHTCASERLARARQCFASISEFSASNSQIPRPGMGSVGIHKSANNLLTQNKASLDPVCCVLCVVCCVWLVLLVWKQLDGVKRLCQRNTTLQPSTEDESTGPVPVHWPLPAFD